MHEQRRKGAELRSIKEEKASVARAEQEITGRQGKDCREVACLLAGREKLTRSPARIEQQKAGTSGDRQELRPGTSAEMRCNQRVNRGRRQLNSGSQKMRRARWRVVDGQT